jgi:hypothetical protein
MSKYGMNIHSREREEDCFDMTNRFLFYLIKAFSHAYVSYHRMVEGSVNEELKRMQNKATMAYPVATGNLILHIFLETKHMSPSLTFIHPSVDHRIYLHVLCLGRLQTVCLPAFTDLTCSFRRLALMTSNGICFGHFLRDFGLLLASPWHCFPSALHLWT